MTTPENHTNHLKDNQPEGRSPWKGFKAGSWQTEIEDIEHLADFVAELQSVERVEVLTFHKMGEHKWEALNQEYQLKESESPSEELIARVQDQFRRRNLTAY